MAILRHMFGLAGLLWSMVAAAQVQIPLSVQSEARDFQERFITTLDEECASRMCYPVGCEVSRFDTLDEAQTSSLPGLDEEKQPQPKVQYKLSSVICEFTHEADLPEATLQSLKQRLEQKVKKVGVAVLIRARRLAPKVGSAEPTTPPEKPNMGQLPWQKGLWTILLPFIPWLLSAIIIAGLIAFLLWSFRKLGRKPVTRDPGSRTRISDNGREIQALAENRPAPTANMLITRIGNLKTELASDQKLVIQTLKKHFEDENYDELCLFLRHFGAELMSPIKDMAEYKQALVTLSDRYRDFEREDSPAELWEFLDRLEKGITAVKVRIDQRPLADEFSFLISLDVEEFLGLLKEIEETEAIALVAYAPRRLREKFFAHANPTFTARFIEQLTRVDKIPDAFVRQVAAKVRQIYYEKGENFKSAKVDSVPLLEQALNSLEPANRKALVLSLNKGNPDVIRNLVATVFLDDCLPLLTDDMLTELFLAIPPMEAAAYLEHHSWGDGVLGRINPRIKASISAHRVKSVLDNKAFVQAASRKIAAFIKEKDAEGRIDLKSLNEKLMG